MAFKVFISHSVAPRELGIVYAIANEGARQGASPYIPDRDWEPKDGISERIQAHLRSTDFLLAIATSSGFHLEWLNREVKEGRKKKKPLLIIADRKVRVPQRLPRIWIDRTNPAETVRKVSEHLAKFGKDKETKELLAWIGVGGLLLLLLRGSKIRRPGTREVVDWEKIVKKLNALEAIAGLLTDLTPQQIKKFDKAVKRKPLFKK